jgi:YVTN family beta-propeller protein
MLFTDIEGSTRLVHQLGERYGELLAGQRQIVRDAVAAHGGREMDNQGDAFFFAFTGARDAALAAVDAQRGLAAHEWPDGVECRVRMGLHTGEPSVHEEGYHGIGLSRGARIAHLARGGQVLVSTTTAELLQDDLPAGVSVRDLGARKLKDIDRPERVYELVADGLPIPPPEGAGRSSRRTLAIVATVVAGAAAAAVAVVLSTRGGSGPQAAGAAVSVNAVGIFKAATGRPAGQIDVGSSPGAVTEGASSIWVANVDDHSVSRIDPVNQVVSQTLQVGNGPAGIAFGGRFVWVTNALDGTITQIDPETNTVVNPAIPVGNRPSGIAVGRRFVWVANSGDSSVSRISLATGRVVPGAIAVDGGATGIAVGDGSVWVTGQATGTVTRIDERSGTVLGPIHAGSGADAVAAERGAVWVANTLDGTVTRIDPETNAVASTIQVGDGPSGIAVAPGSVWVSNSFGGTLSRIDPIRNVSVQTVTTGNRPQGLVVEPDGLFVAVRASGVGHRGGTLRILGASGYLDYAVGYLKHIDPSTAYIGDEVGVARLTNDGLVGYLKTGGAAGLALVPDLAVSLPSPTDGGRTYSFQLRPGIRYSTGGVVRPADVRASLERSLEAGGGYDPYFAHIVGAGRCLAEPEKPCDLSRGIETHAGSNTVTFHLTSPDPNFLHELTLPPAFVVPAGTPLHGHGFAPATGPYEVDSWNPKTGVRLVRNPRFREWSPAAQPSGLPDVIDERLGGSMDARVAKVLRGDADLAVDDDEAPSQAVVESVRTQHAALLKISPSDGTWYLALNTRTAPFDSLDARKALNLAIDRTRLSDLAFGPGVSHVTCQILPPDFPGYRRYCPYTAAPNLAQARKLVRASGTFGSSVTVWAQSFFKVPPPARRYIVSVLERLGYKARFRTFSGLGKNNRQVVYDGWYPDYAAPAGFLLATLTCAASKQDPARTFNDSGFCDPAIDREIARADALQATNPRAASQLWAKVDRDLTDRAPWAAFANNSFVEVTSPRVRNYQVNQQLGTLIDQLWVH